jgi:hypothetical protein
MQTRNLSRRLTCAGFVSLLLQGAAAAQGVGSPAEPVLSQITSNQAVGAANCRDYSTLATINGRQVPIVGRACKQSDGSWRLAESAPGNPTQYVATYLPSPAAYEGYGDPILWAFPIGFSIGLPFFIDQHNRFHRFRDFAHFSRAGGFGHDNHFGGFHDGYGRR